VLDLKKSIIVEDVFMQVPSRNGESYYLVVQMQPAPEEKKLEIPTILKKDFSKPQEKIKSEPVKKEGAISAPAPPSPPEPIVPAYIPIPKPKPERFVIVIDAGHGGVDPGAIGALGTKEKNITLRYAQHLRDVLRASGRYKVVMTRDGDKFIPLRGRLKKAQEAQGHLFISLHADTNPEPTMTGLSVYTLSENASDEEAAALAERENKRDIITGVDLSGQSKDVAEVLIDLAQRETNNTSARFAELVVAELGTEAKLLKNTHRFAGFAVLKGVGVPSALVELGYLSNPSEEKQLIRSDYQDKLVNAIARAIDTYCDQYAIKE
jgi:N-acetylmuramoyl-L-alanine amidase